MLLRLLFIGQIDTALCRATEIVERADGAVERPAFDYRNFPKLMPSTIVVDILLEAMYAFSSLLELQALCNQARLATSTPRGILTIGAVFSLLCHFSQTNAYHLVLNIPLLFNNELAK